MSSQHWDNTIRSIDFTLDFDIYLASTGHCYCTTVMHLYTYTYTLHTFICESVSRKKLQVKCNGVDLLPPTSAVEVIESVPCFHLSVRQCSHGQTAWHADTKFHIRIDLDVVWRHKMTSWHQLTSQNDVVTSNNVSTAKTNMTYTGEGLQRWGVFINMTYGPDQFPFLRVHCQYYSLRRRM